MDEIVTSVTMRPEDYYVLRHELSDLREKENKYKWHDLRKNIDDLPEEYHNYGHLYSDNVLVLIDGKDVPKVAYINLTTREWFDSLDEDDVYDVIMWKYIEMPEPEETSASGEE